MIIDSLKTQPQQIMMMGDGMIPIKIENPYVNLREGIFYYQLVHVTQSIFSSLKYSFFMSAPMTTDINAMENDLYTLFLIQLGH